MATATASASLSSEQLRRARLDLVASLQQIDTRLKQNHIIPNTPFNNNNNFRITTSSANNQRTFSSTGAPPEAKRIRLAHDNTNGNLTITTHHFAPPPPSYNEQQPPSSTTPDEESTAPSRKLHSSIFTTNKVIKTKDDLISLVNRDTESTGRNRRMFGVLLGTLNKARAEANSYNEATSGQKRHEIERRLDQKQRHEKEVQQHEVSELLSTQKSYREKLKQVNIKLEIVERMASHEKLHEPLKNFIRTKASPPIFYLPRHFDDCPPLLKEKLDESRKEVEKEMDEFKKDCQRDLDLLDDDVVPASEPSAAAAVKKEEEEPVVDDMMGDLPDEITFSADVSSSSQLQPAIRSEVTLPQSPPPPPVVGETTVTTTTVTSTRTVIFDQAEQQQEGEGDAEMKGEEN